MEPLSANDPRAIGEFRLHARLGAGGMGQVYLGFSPAGRPVAIKVVHPQYARDTEFLQRFSREVAAAGAVSGMYTAPVVASGLNDDPPWLATAYVPGPPLAAVVAKHGPLPEAAVWRLAAGLAEALHAVHAAGLVHRDLKPANVLLADDGPHVIDFGISRAFQATLLTSGGMVIGTPGYMSPEQAESEAAGPASDIFSLGCVLAYASTGQPPFGSGSSASIMYRVVKADPDLSAVPPALRQVIEACLKKNQEERPAPAQLIAMISALGPAAEATLGSFWPESAARVIAAEQASQMPAGLTPPRSVPASATGLTGHAGTISIAGVAVPGGAAVPASPAPAERTPTALATPGPGAGGGATGHAPMLSDGYYAAAAQHPAAAGPVIPPVPAAPQGYRSQSQPGQGTAGLAVYGQAPNGQASYGQTPYGTSAYGAIPYGQAPAPHPGPGTPYQGQASPSSWPPRQDGPTPWLAAGLPGAHGGQDALAQYTLGSRKPTAAEVPRPVHTAIKFMYAGFAATLVALIASLVALGRYTHDASVAKAAAAHAPVLGLHRVADLATMNADNRMAGAMTIAVVADLLGLACWPWIKVACRRGRGWTQSAGTALLGVYTLVLLVVLFSSHNDPGARAATLVVWALGLGAAVPLWTQQAREFFFAWRKR